ncbi:hypothetical protein [Marinicella rhabdoformis]|uniref:hypothetical protein n=1 Tax=Marinicella rhabdoformis TaxID=2580566 RepID=UPI0012AEE02A|nr:hypothetical protein [Marinicella rhabdoformis]
MKYYILFIILCCGNVHSSLYSDDEIAQFLKEHQTQSSPLVTSIFTDKQPLKTLNNWLISKKLNDLEKEFQLYALLNQLATTPPDNHFLPLLEKLSLHQSKTFKNHPEGKYHGHAPIELFNISAKANGVLNIWSMKNAQSQASNIINNPSNVVEALEQLLNHKTGHIRPVQLGIKNAFQVATNNQLKHVKQAFYRSPHIPSVLHTTLADLVVVSADIEFATWALGSVNKQQAERTYRLIAKEYPQQQSIDLLTRDIDSKANPNFIVTLLTPHINQNKVADYLLDKLTKESTTEGAAYVLSKSNDPLLWKKMEQIHNTTTSEAVKSKIRLSFKHNQNEAAQFIFKRIEKMEAIHEF